MPKLYSSNFVMPCQTNLVAFYPKSFTLLGFLFISSLEKCYFFILLLKIVAQGDYCYRVESVRKCICSRSRTPMDSKAHNFFLDVIIDYFLLSCTPWNVGFKIRQIGSHFIMFQILLLMLTFPWAGPAVLMCVCVRVCE